MGWCTCLFFSLILAMLMPHVSSPLSQTADNFSDPSSVTAEYLNLKNALNKAWAMSLPPHCPYDCTFDLLPGTVPPRRRLFFLSALEKLAMVKYILEYLAAGLIHLFSSPAGAGFLFIIIDFHGYNNIAIMNPYPLPFISSLPLSCSNGPLCTCWILAIPIIWCSSWKEASVRWRASMKTWL